MTVGSAVFRFATQSEQNPFPISKGLIMTFRYSAHIGYLFSDRPIRQRIEAASAHGFDGVEYPSPYGISPHYMAAWLERCKMTYTQFGLYSGDADQGEKGIGIFPDRRDEFRRSVTDALNYAEVVGVKMLHAMSGVLAPEKRSQGNRDCYIENLDYAARQAKSRGIRILIEPMSPGAVPNYFVSTADQAADIVAETGSDNIGLLFDVFHTASIGQDIHRQIEKFAALIWHVHIADVPGRHEPGSETLDFDSIRDTLASVGYQGWLGCEYKPARSTEAGLAWLSAARMAPRASSVHHAQSKKVPSTA